MCNEGRERGVGIIYVRKIYDDLALEAWTQRKKGRERKGGREAKMKKSAFHASIALIPSDLFNQSCKKEKLKQKA